MWAACSRFVVSVPLMCALTGCSWHYIDSAGNEKILGLSLITLVQHKCTLTSMVTIAGLTLDTTRDFGGLNFGYKASSSVHLKPNVLGSAENSSLLLIMTNDSTGSGFTERNCELL